MRISIAAAVALLLASMVARFVVWPNAQRNIEFVPNFADLGSVLEETYYTGEFQIRNNSNQVWRITGIKTSCYCTAADIELPSTLPPAKSVRLPFSYYSGRGDGLRSQNLVLRMEKLSNGKAERFLKPFAISCKIQPELRATPSVINFGTLGLNEKVVSIPFRVSCPAGRSYEVVKTRSTSQFISVSHPTRFSGSDNACSLEVSSPTAGSKGMLSGEVIFDLDGGRVSSFAVPFQAILEPRFEITPDVLVYSDDSQNRLLLMKGKEAFRVEIDTPPEVSVTTRNLGEYSTVHEVNLALENGVGRSINSSLGDAVAVLVTSSGHKSEFRIKQRYWKAKREQE